MKHIKEYEQFNEAKKLGLGDKGVDYNDNVVEIIAIGNYDKIAKMLKKETGNSPEDYGYEKAPGNFYLTKNIESTEGNVGDVFMYPVKYDMANYWGLDPVKESLNEAVTNGMNEAYKLGDSWSKDFDYIGMLEMGAKANMSMGAKKLQSLFDSFEDVNYHSEASPLSFAIDEIKDGNKAEAKRLMKEFNANCKKTLEGLK